jgi:WD40 repeat protein
MPQVVTCRQHFIVSFVFTEPASILLNDLTTHLQNKLTRKNEWNNKVLFRDWQQISVVDVTTGQVEDLVFLKRFGITKEPRYSNAIVKIQNTSKVCCITRGYLAHCDIYTRDYDIIAHNDQNDSFTCIAEMNDRILVGSFRGTVTFYHPYTLKKVKEWLPKERRTTISELTPITETIVTILENNTVITRSVVTDQIISTINLNCRLYNPKAVALPNCRLAVNDDCDTVILDCKVGVATTKWKHKDKVEHIICIGDHLVASYENSKFIIFWNPEFGTCVKVLNAFQASKFFQLPGDKLLLSSGIDMYCYSDGELHYLCNNSCKSAVALYN